MRCFALLIAGLALLAGVAAAVSGGATQAKTRWVITDLGMQYAFAINDHGQIIGLNHGDAVVWESGKLTRLKPLRCRLGRGAWWGSRGWNRPNAINERGQIVGRCGSDTGPQRAVLWQDGKVIDLGALPHNRYSVAVAINDRGQVVGYSWSRFSEAHESEPASVRAFLWEKGKMTNLGTVGGQDSAAVAINNRGQVVVAVGDWALRETDAYLWENGRLTRLGPRAGEGEAVDAINDHGQIIGQATRANFRSYAFLWEKGKMIDLGFLDAKDINERGQIVGSGSKTGVLWQDGKKTALGSLSPSDINDQGQVVGSTSGTGGSTRPVLWQNGTKTALPTLGGKWSGAEAINEHGQIIGSTGSRYVLWTLPRG